MVTKHSVLGRILSALLLAFYLLYVVPHLKPTLVSLFVVAVSIGLIADVLARFFAGRNDWKILITIALIVAANVLFLLYIPASPI